MTSEEAPITRLPLIIVKRAIYDQFDAGTKTVEYRLHRPPFTIKTFYPGRWVRISYTYNIKLATVSVLRARVVKFELKAACDRDLPPLDEFYKGLRPADEIALITLDINR